MENELINSNNNQDKKEDRQEILIKIQTMENSYPIKTFKDSTVEELKKKITEKFNVDDSRQKLIYQGRVLKNNEILYESRITENSVIHLAVKPEESTQSNEVGNSNSNNNLNPNQVESLSNSNNNANNEELISNLIEIPILRTRSRRRNRTTGTFDISDSYEAMHQNITTINNILKCRKPFNEREIINTHTITPFDYSNFKYEPGQWLDAKDTIDQWIEAQVVQVRNNEAYIHYNGWGVRWDEYIDFSSPRLAPFKTYSINHNNASCYSSPYPAIIPDANLEQLQRNLDTFYYLDKAYQYIGELKSQIENIYKLRKKKQTSFYQDNIQLRIIEEK